MKKHAKVEVSSGEVHEVDYDHIEFKGDGLMVFYQSLPFKIDDREVAIFSCHSLISCTITDNNKE